MFFYFGPTPDSWAIGNDVFSYAQNLPSAIQQVWDRLGSIYHDPSSAGTLISWMSTSLDGAYAVMTKGGELLCNRQDVLAAATPVTAVDHISFSPEGSWFIRFTDGTVQLSKSGFSQAFYGLVRPYLDASSGARQYSRICDVFFGAHGAAAVRTDTELLCEGLPPGLQQSLQSFDLNGELRSRGFILGRNTVFCPLQSEYYFLDAHSPHELPRCIHQLPREVPLEFTSSIISGQKPPMHLMPKASHQPIRSHSHSPPNNHASFCHHHRPSRSEAWSSSIPASARARYESQFAHESQGKPHLTGIEAAMIFQASGLSKSELSRIWEQTDKDQNGRFDREEFVQAMWLMDLQTGRVGQVSLPGPPAQTLYAPVAQPPTQGYRPHNQAVAAGVAAAAAAAPAPPPPPPSLSSSHNQLQDGQWQQNPPPPPPRPPPAYTSQPPSHHPPPYQSGPPFTNAPSQQPLPQPMAANGIATVEITAAVVCIDCESGLVPGDIVGHCPICKDLYCQTCRPRACRCPHSLQQASLKLAQNVPSRASTSCDECLRSIKKEQVVWLCEKCWHKKLCEKCWRKKKRHCKHAAQGQVQMLTVGKKSKDDVGEIFEAFGEVVGALAGG